MAAYGVAGGRQAWGWGVVRESRETYAVPPDDPLMQALDVITSRWLVHIVLALEETPLRFNALARRYRINPNSLSERLKEMERHGLISRHELSKLPPGVEYRLTTKGRELAAALLPLKAWASDWAS